MAFGLCLVFVLEKIYILVFVFKKIGEGAALSFFVICGFVRIKRIIPLSVLP